MTNWIQPISVRIHGVKFNSYVYWHYSYNRASFPVITIHVYTFPIIFVGNKLHHFPSLPFRTSQSSYQVDASNQGYRQRDYCKYSRATGGAYSMNWRPNTHCETSCINMFHTSLHYSDHCPSKGTFLLTVQYILLPFLHLLRRSFARPLHTPSPLTHHPYTSLSLFLAFLIFT